MYENKAARRRRQRKGVAVTGPLTPERKQGIRERIEKERTAYIIRMLAANWHETDAYPEPIRVVWDERFAVDEATRLAIHSKQVKDGITYGVTSCASDSDPDISDLYESHEALLGAFAEILRKAEECFAADMPDGGCVRDHETGRRLAYSVAAKISRAALRNAGVTL